MNEIRFNSILPVEIPVTLGDQRYVLREPRSERIKPYKEAVADCAVTDGQGKVVSVDTKKAGESNLLLLSLCLFDSQDKEVPLATVASWPTRIVDRLEKACLKLCGMLGDEESQLEWRDDLKN